MTYEIDAKRNVTQHYGVRTQRIQQTLTDDLEENRHPCRKHQP